MIQKILEEFMLFYNFNSLDNFIRNNFIENLTQENENIKRILNLYSNHY